ncbi:MAG: hypothetical protein J6A65_14425 [Pseudomonas sp.]|nr:hypothetical protein [Pseudomonas sp.]
MSLFEKIFGTYSSKQIKKIEPTIKKIEALEDKYAAMGEKTGDRDELGKFKSVLTQVVNKVLVAGNLVIVKTIPGAAQAACAAIDSHGFAEICGSIAGDDTIFLAVACDEDARSLCNKLKDLR